LVDEDSRLRIQAARAEAFELGYRLFVDEAINMPAPITHMAFAAPAIQQTSMARFLTYGSSVLEAAEAGLEVLRGIVERDEPWPKG